MTISKRIVLHFPKRLVDKPIIVRLVKDFDLEFNILKAQVTPREEGLLALELTGEEANYTKGLEYLIQSGVRIQPLSQDIRKNDNRCTDCGICISVCPTPALVIDQNSRKVIFDSNHCVACELCVKICPVKAMEVHF